MNRQPDMRQIMAQAQRCRSSSPRLRKSWQGGPSRLGRWGDGGGHGHRRPRIGRHHHLLGSGRSGRCGDAPRPRAPRSARPSRPPPTASRNWEGLTGGSRPRRPARLMFEGPVQRLIDEMARLPGIGQKTAQRLAFHLLSVEEADARRLATAIDDMRDQVTLCERCFNVAAGEQCVICRDSRRDNSMVCVWNVPRTSSSSSGPRSTGPVPRARRLAVSDQWRRPGSAPDRRVAGAHRSRGHRG